MPAVRALKLKNQSCQNKKTKFYSSDPFHCMSSLQTECLAKTKISILIRIVCLGCEGWQQVREINLW